MRTTWVGWAIGAANLVLFGCGLLGCGGATSNEPATRAPRFAQVSVEEVARGIAGPERRLAVFDANSRELYEARHVPGAVWVDYDAFAREQLPADLATPLVFYCYNEQCSASHVAAERAIDFGFTNVAVMGAGIAGWQAAGQPIEGTSATATQ